MRWTGFILLLACIAGRPDGALAQMVSGDTIPEKALFGQIPDSLHERQPGHDYPYEYLSKQVDIRFSDSGGRIMAVLEYHYRLKVYTDDPYITGEAALVGIPYYSQDGIEEITDIEGFTHLPDGSSIALDSREVRTAELNSRYRIHEFIMPGVVQGAIIEYRYVMNRQYIDELPDFNFSHRVPTVLAHLTLRNEDYLRFDSVGSNLDFDVHYQEQRTDTSDVPLVFTYRRPEPVSVEHWYARDVPAVDDLAYISSLEDIRGKLKFQVSEFGRPRQPLGNSWELVAAQIRRGDSSPFESNEVTRALEEQGRQLARGADSPEQAVEAIFREINSRMTFNGVRRPFPETPPEGVMEGDPSDQAAVNLALLAMLKGAEVDAWPLYLSGRNFGRINRSFPSVYQFNQLLVAVGLPGEVILLDASFPNSRPGLIPVESFNEMGMVLRPDGLEWMEIRPGHSYFDLDVDMQAELNAAGDLTGVMRVVTGGYPAHDIREALTMQSDAEQVLRESFFDIYPEIRLFDTVIRELEEGKYPLEIEVNFEIPSYAISFVEGLQFSPMIVGYRQGNPFEEGERSAPITLDAPEMLNIHYRIRLPEGYSMDEERQNGVTSMRGAELREAYEASGRDLSYEFNVHIRQSEFPADDYGQLRRLYDRWVWLSTNEWFIEKGNE